MVDYNVKITEIENKLANHNHDKYIDIADVFNARLAQAKLITKTEFYSKLSSLNRKIQIKKSTYLLKMN